MKLSLFNENAKVLLVGEGNFSFAVTLVKHNLNVRLIATCYEKDVNETGKKNIDILKSHGIHVLVGVDATKFEEHKILSSQSFDIVVFNFPHVGGKMRIEKNRELLRQFFISVKSVLHKDGKVLMSLCDGQGGTPADTSRRQWNDSWQVTEMAAHGSFVLLAIEPFDSSLFKTYTVTGYRSLEKKFNTEGSLTHVFKRADRPDIVNIAPKTKINLQKNNYKPIEWENSKRIRIISSFLYKSFHSTHQIHEHEHVASALRNTKPKSDRDTLQYFVDMKQVRVQGGKGGDGAISFLQLWVNERAGPDGGDGGHGGHVIFQVSADVKDLSTVSSVLEAESGEDGHNKDCFGKNAKHNIIKVPVGTIVRDTEGTILADLDEEGMMYIAARGGAGGHGNAFFKSNMNQSPKISEYGAEGESKQYVLEVRSMAHVGLIGLPNAGKSTLLRAISRARPKVASYPFTTLRPHIGMIQYDDYEQIAVADLPGLIPDSHKNKGLGITFLKHAERCAALLFIVDLTQEEPWTHFEILQYEISQFNDKLNDRPMIIIANKVDLPEAKENLKLLKEKIDLPIIPISAKMGTNVATLLKEIRKLYDLHFRKNE
ncbi:mitochondrial ribosome-associated GTPase 2 isoform X2 [Nasonia vitripennis]|uniref:GTP-binding protein 5 n=1 Tax=Nasonia vitripennis TaxID=7425 RepID=A0A7M7H853_NASVI|nr:mitochondrial ribosome-associated GTPase 2 isoform X2 [Nasonia vitripennis]